jgi:two-component system, chemotaxis family, protein-glutamate methylesterase/glutaminase
VPLMKRLLQPGQRIKVLVVDDSVVIRRLVTHALSEDPAIEVVGVASNGSIALQRISHLNPDVITLDIEMPEMDGLEMLRQLRKAQVSARVIMFSTMTARGAEITLEALSLGADDYVTKASNEGSLDRSMARLREELIPKVKQFFHLPGSLTAPIRPVATAPDIPAPGSSRLRPRAVLLGVSTGGPTALSEILPAFPADFPLPIVVVQHMPPMFTRLLAERLAHICRLAVQEGVQGQVVTAGNILIAPGDFHLKLIPAGPSIRVCLDQSPHLNSCRPAVDALFISAAEAYSGAVVAAVLTGMGQDGLRGAQVLKARGGTLLAQDEASSVVWGMPGAVVNAGLADCVLPLRQIVPEILRRAERVT